MRTVGWLKKELKKFSDDADCWAYEDEFTGVVIGGDNGGEIPLASIDGSLQGPTVIYKEQEMLKKLAEKYPAEVIVHWPTGPVSMCKNHAGGLVQIGNVMGSHTVVTELAENDHCVTCKQEGDQDE